MDLNFTFSPSPSKRLRTQLLSADSPVKESPDKTKTAARDLLSGALKEAIKKEDDDISDLDSLPTPMKNLMASGLSPFTSPTKSARKRKRKSLDKAAGYHHTFVMKLFDRSVDLAQFRPQTSSDAARDSAVSSYPLYPVARAWIRNEPSNLNQAPPAHPETSPEPDMECPEEADSVTRLPPPEPLADDVRSLRVPEARESGLPSVLDLELDHGGDSGPPANVLLSNHLVKWWSVRKSWKQASAENEKRYQKSLNILKDIYDNVK